MIDIKDINVNKTLNTFEGRTNSLITVNHNNKLYHDGEMCVYFNN